MSERRASCGCAFDAAWALINGCAQYWSLLGTEDDRTHTRQAAVEIVREFQRTVVAYARLRGWLVGFTWRSLHSPK